MTLLSVAVLLMASAQAAERPLPSSLGPALEAAFSGPALEWRLDGAQIDRTTAALRVCAAPGGACHELALTAPSANCPHERAGPWCVRLLPPLPQTAQRSSLLRALAGVTVQAPDPAPPREVVAWPQLLALALLLAPLLLGVGLRAALARRLPRWRRASLGVTALLLALALPFGIWDRALAASLLLAGAALSRARGAGVALLLGLLFGGALFELSARLVLPTPPLFPPPEHMRLLAWGGADYWKEAACHLIDPDQAGQPFDDRIGRPQGPDGAPAVLHLGDSMLHGLHAPRDASLTAHLARLQPGARHVNLGVPDSGPDLALAIARAWLPAFPTAEVVLHLYPGNDLADLDQPYPCCATGPLLLLGPEAASACPPLTPLGGPGAWLRRSLSGSAPYPLRVATAWSHAARHLLAIGAAGAAPRDPEQDPALARLSAVLRALRALTEARGLPLTVLLMPNRREHLGAPAERARHRQLRQLVAARADELGLRVLDAASAVPMNDEASFAADPPGDIHLSRAGYRGLAEWMLRASKTE
jgi:hypothetical protein